MSIAGTRSASISGCATSRRNPLPVVVLQRTLRHRRRLQRLRRDAGRWLPRSCGSIASGRAMGSACGRWSRSRKDAVAAPGGDLRRFEPGRRAAAVSSTAKKCRRPCCAIAFTSRPSVAAQRRRAISRSGERFRDRGFKDGEIDELRVFDRALAPLEIRQLARRPSAGGCARRSAAPSRRAAKSSTSRRSMPMRARRRSALRDGAAEARGCRRRRSGSARDGRAGRAAAGVHPRRAALTTPRRPTTIASSATRSKTF